MGGKLVGQRTRKPLSLIVSECLFADDVHMAVVASTRTEYCSSI